MRSGFRTTSKEQEKDYHDSNQLPNSAPDCSNGVFCCVERHCRRTGIDRHIHLCALDSEEQQPVFVATSAHNYPHSIGFAEMREKLDSDQQTPYCLLFGTGWGLHPEIIEEVDLLLAPIVGHGDYNHLSVRGAAAIILDRLRGAR